MTGLVPLLRELIRAELDACHWPQLGVVTAVYPHRAAADVDNYGCDVRLKDTGVELKRVPLATGHVGTAAAPNVGDLVLVVFAQGGPHLPVVVGRFYTDGQRPPANRENEVIVRLPPGRPDAETVRLDARAGDAPRELVIRLAPRVTVRATDQEILLTTGGTVVRLRQPGDAGGTVVVSAGGSEVTIAQDGDVRVKSAAAMHLEAAGDLTLRGARVRVEATADAAVEAGTQLALKGGVGASVEGGATAGVRAPMVSLAGQIGFSP